MSYLDICRVFEFDVHGFLSVLSQVQRETYENSALRQLMRPGWLGYIGDDKLPSYMGIIINQYNDP